MLAWVGKLLADYLWAKLLALVCLLVGWYLRHRKTEKEAKESVEALKKAVTEKEIDDATRNSLDGM